MYHFQTNQIMNTLSYPSSYNAALGLLFARYVSGIIAERTWQTFMWLMDSPETTLSEREAFVRILMTKSAQYDA